MRKALLLPLVFALGLGAMAQTAKPKISNKPLAAVSSATSSTGCTVAPCTITWSWTDSTDSAATYEIYYVQFSNASSSSVCPAAPTSSPPSGYSSMVSGLAAGTTSYSETGVGLGTLTCAVATATDPTSGLQSVPSDQASVFIPPAATPPPPPTAFGGSAGPG